MIFRYRQDAEPQRNSAVHLPTAEEKVLTDNVQSVLGTTHLIDEAVKNDASALSAVRRLIKLFENS